jgi:hypothetical protein
MDAPLSGVVDHLGPNLDEPPDDRVYAWLDALAPECSIPNCVEQIVGKTYIPVTTMVVISPAISILLRIFRKWTSLWYRLRLRPELRAGERSRTLSPVVWEKLALLTANLPPIVWLRSGRAM